MGIFSDPVAMQYYPATKTREEDVQWIKYMKKTAGNHGLGLMAVELKTSQPNPGRSGQAAEFVGQCGYWVQQVKSKQEIEIGYLMLRKHWNKGYGYRSGHSLPGVCLYCIGT